MGFADYLWGLLPRIYKRKPDSDVQKWVGSLGQTLDDAKAAIFLTRRAWLIATASGEALDNHGRSRGLPRYPGESDDLYRRRLLAAYEIYVLGGTSRGIIRALDLMGFPNARVHELYKDGAVTPLHGELDVYNGQVQHRGGIRWAEFRVIAGLADDRPFTRDDLAVVQAEIYRMKPAHTMPTGFALELDFDEYVPAEDDAAYQVVFVVHALQETYQWPGAMHAGTLTRNGAALYNTYHDKSALGLDMALSDVQVARGVRYDSWFRHDRAAHHGAQPAVLQTGEVSTVVHIVDLGPTPGESSHSSISWRGREQFPAGPTLHEGGARRAGASRYGQDRVIDTTGAGVRISWADALPGAASYGAAFLLHDGGGARWMHNGVIRHAPFARHNGQRLYRAHMDRRRTVPHWGERALRHNGLAGYGRLAAHNGLMTHGSNGMMDEFSIAVSKNGRAV